MMFWRALAARNMSVSLPPIGRTTAFAANKNRARGREKRANISPVIKASVMRPTKISIMETMWP